MHVSGNSSSSSKILYITTATDEDDWEGFAEAKFEQLCRGWRQRCAEEKQRSEQQSVEKSHTIYENASPMAGAWQGGGGFAMIAFTRAGQFVGHGGCDEEGTAVISRLTLVSESSDIDIRAVRAFVRRHFEEENTHLVFGVHGAGDAISFDSVYLSHILEDDWFDRDHLGGRPVDRETKRVEGPVDYPIEWLLWDLFFESPPRELRRPPTETHAAQGGTATGECSPPAPTAAAAPLAASVGAEVDFSSEWAAKDAARRATQRESATVGAADADARDEWIDDDDAATERYMRFLSVTLDSCLMGELHTVSACYEIANYLIAPEGFMWEEDVDVDKSIFNPETMQILWRCCRSRCYRKYVARSGAGGIAFAADVDPGHRSSSSGGGGGGGGGRGTSSSMSPPMPPTLPAFPGQGLMRVSKKRCDFLERELKMVVQHYCAVSSSGDAALFSTWNGRRMIQCLDNWTEELQDEAAEEPFGVIVSRWKLWSLQASKIVNEYVAVHPDTKADKRRLARLRAKEAKRRIRAECDHLPPFDVEATLKHNFEYDEAGEGEEDRLVDMPLNHHNFYIKSDDLNFHGRWLLDGWSALSELLAAQQPLHLLASLRLASPVEEGQVINNLGVSPIVVEEVCAFWKDLFKNVVLLHEGPRDHSLYVLQPRGFSISLQRSLLGSEGSGSDSRRHYVPHELLRVDPMYVSGPLHEHHYLSSGTET